MTTDRELLEDAARAAGLTIGDWTPGSWLMRYEGTQGNHSKHRWNPLLDDGDEARLEAACELQVGWFTSRVGVFSEVGSVHERYVDHGGDKQAARRRAGVRAAAEIGRAMKEADHAMHHVR